LGNDCSLYARLSLSWDICGHLLQQSLSFFWVHAAIFIIVFIFLALLVIHSHFSISLFLVPVMTLFPLLLQYLFNYINLLRQSFPFNTFSLPCSINVQLSSWAEDHIFLIWCSLLLFGQLQSYRDIVLLSSIMNPIMKVVSH